MYMYPTTRRCNTFGKFKQHFIFIAVRHRRSSVSNVKFEFKAHKAFKILKWGQPQTSCLTVYSASKLPDAWGSSICGSESRQKAVGRMVDGIWWMADGYTRQPQHTETFTIENDCLRAQEICQWVAAASAWAAAAGRNFVSFVLTRRLSCMIIPKNYTDIRSPLGESQQTLRLSI